MAVDNLHTDTHSLLPLTYVRFRPESSHLNRLPAMRKMGAGTPLQLPSRAGQWSSRVIDRFWRPRVGTTQFIDVRYSTLVAMADIREWSKKMYNNAISVLRRAFKFGYRDYPGKHNPTLRFASARIKRKDRATVDPFTIHERRH